MAQLLDLTIAIPVKNEEQNLPGCLAAIGNDFAKKIVVIDSGSTDGTKLIAVNNGVEFISFKWNGHYPKKRNWFLENYTPQTTWVLFLDADEYLTEGFKAEVRTALCTQDDTVGHWLNYTTYFMGKVLKGGYPLRKLALFKVGAGLYERIDEDHWSRLDMEVHEHPVLKGKTGVIKCKIDHRDYGAIDRYITKHNEYASWEAERFIKTFHDTTSASVWTWKQRLKYRLLKSSLIGPVYFIGSFFLMRGWMDGRTGFLFAVLKMSYFTQIHIRIKERLQIERPKKITS